MSYGARSLLNCDPLSDPKAVRICFWRNEGDRTLCRPVGSNGLSVIIMMDSGGRGIIRYRMVWTVTVRGGSVSCAVELGHLS
ncbi:MAG: hypothetical protein IJY04_04200, partial [Clostridia bacterium]|nr:hypothetical protein [Clostridia bacterium]